MLGLYVKNRTEGLSSFFEGSLLSQQQREMTTLKNSVRLIGFLETDPEFDEINKRVRFSLATSDSHYEKDGKLTKTYQWHNIVATGDANDSVFENLTRGMEITLEGRLTYHRFIDDQGNGRFITEIVANDILVLEAKV